MASLIHESYRPRKPWRVDYVERRQTQTRRFATKAEAERFIGDLARGASRRLGRITVKEWIALWIESHGPGWEARTAEDRGDFADKWITPFMGKMLLTEVGRSDVRDLRNWMRRRKATAYTANRIVQVLSAALGAAVDDDLIPANPCRGLKPLPREKVTRRRAATPDEVELIRAHLLTERDRAIVSLMAYAGLRPSEVHALAWEDVLGKTLVVRAAARERGEDDKDTKTGSVRSDPIVPALADDLAQLRREGLHVIGALDHRHWTSSPWRTAREKAGIPGGDGGVTPYSLRHTFASLLIAEGRNPWQVAALMGHANPQMVITTYGHLFAEAELAKPVPMAKAVAQARQRALATLRASSPSSPR